VDIEKEMSAIKKAVDEKNPTRLFALATESTDESIRTSAVREYIRTMPAQFDKSFVHLYEKNVGFSPKTRKAVLKGIASFADGDEGFTALFVKAAEKDADIDCKVAALRGVSVNLKGKEVPEIAKAVLEHENEKVRMAVLGIVENCVVGNSGTTIVRNYMDDKSIAIVQKAVEVAGRKGLTSVKPQLMTIVKSGVYEQSGLEQIKIAALESLHRLAGDDADVVPLIKACAESGNAQIRTAALKLLVPPREVVDPEYLAKIIDGFASGDRVTVNDAERLLKKSMPQAVDQLVKLLSGNTNFVVLDKCAAVALSQSRYELLDLLTAKIKEGNAPIFGKYSSSREVVHREYLPTADGMLALWGRLGSGQHTRLASVTSAQADSMLLFLNETDPYFERQDTAWRSNRGLVGAASLLKAFCLWDANERDASAKLFSVVEQKHFDQPVITVFRIVGSSGAVAAERFRCQVASRLGVYAAAMLSALHLCDGDKESAIRVMSSAINKGKTAGSQVSDGKYSVLRSAHLKSIAQHKSEAGEPSEASEREMRTQFKAESMDIQLALKLLSMHQERGDKENEKDVLQYLKKTWPVTLEEM
jgi:hypothetical protein